MRQNHIHADPNGQHLAWKYSLMLDEPQSRKKISTQHWPFEDLGSGLKKKNCKGLHNI